jgi:YfiH family protein
MEDALLSPLLAGHGFRHAFTVRRSPGGAGAPESLQALRRRAAGAMGCAPERLFEVTQVHGAAVKRVNRREHRETLLAQQADALVTNEPGAALAVRVADCLPLLLADPRTGSVAAIHAGWRGIEAGVVRAGLEALLRLPGVQAKDLVAAIFPHIRACCFEVGDDVAARLQVVCAGSGAVKRRNGKKPHVDLAAVVRVQLASGGVDGQRVQEVAGCTCCDPERFFSYRRQGEIAGRHLAAIAVRR